MLNSAVGVTLPPSKKPPPISTISLDARRDPRLADQRQGDVGERPERAQRDRAARLVHQRLDDEIDGILFLQRHRRLRQIRPVETGLAVHLLGGDQFAHQRPDRSGIDLDVRPAGEFADLAGVLLGQLQRHVAGDGCDAEHLQFGAAERQQDGDGVVLAGIGVDDDLRAWGI